VLTHPIWHLALIDPSATGNSTSAGPVGVIIVIAVVVVLIAGIALRKVLRKRQ
jgi:hypothetical protein